MIVAAVGFGLLNVIVSVDIPPWLIVAGLKDFPTDGTTTDDTAVRLEKMNDGLGPAEVFSAPGRIALVNCPDKGAVTLTESVHVAPAAIEPPVRVTELVVWLATPVPQLVWRAVPATVVRPAGKVSVNLPMILTAALLGLVSVMLSVAVPPALIVDIGVKSGFKKALPTVGTTGGADGPAPGRVTLRVAEAPPLALPTLVNKFAPASSFAKVPEAAANTVTVILQEPPAGMDPPVKVTEKPSVDALPPGQLVIALDATSPDGKKSISGKSMFASTVLGLLKVMVSCDVDPGATVTGLKDFPKNGGTSVEITFKVAHAASRFCPKEV